MKTLTQTPIMNLGTKPADNLSTKKPAKRPTPQIKGAASYQTRYRNIMRARASTDHEAAVLASEIRAEFPKGAAGDSQFRVWCREHLNVSPGRAMVLQRMSKAWAAGFRNADDYRAVGGWPTISFLMHLPSKRSKVYAAALAKAKESPHGSIEHLAVREIAHTMGVKTNRRGRPSRTVSEDRLRVLRDYCVKLHAEYILPPPPPSVEQALTPTKLAEIRKAVAAAK